MSSKENMSLQLLSSSREQTVTLKEIADLLDVRHNDAVNVLVRMMENPEFGLATKFSCPVISGKGREQFMKTYHLNKRQSIAVSARLNTGLLMRILDRWQELESQQQKFPQTYIEALEAFLESKKAEEKLLAENTKLQITLDESKEWMSIKKVANHNHVSWREISSVKLKRADASIVHEPKPIFDANYGKVNAYHVSAWEETYPELELPLD
jgi:phage regulator Rha-like protein